MDFRIEILTPSQIFGMVEFVLTASMCIHACVNRATRVHLTTSSQDAGGRCVSSDHGETSPALSARYHLHAFYETCVSTAASPPTLLIFSWITGRHLGASTKPESSKKHNPPVCTAELPTNVFSCAGKRQI